MHLITCFCGLKNPLLSKIWNIGLLILRVVKQWPTHFILELAIQLLYVIILIVFVLPLFLLCVPIYN